MLRVLFIFAHFLGVLSLTFVLPALAASMAGEPELVTSFVITGVLGLFVSGSLVLGLRGREQRLKRHERYLLAALLFIGLPIFAAIPIGLSVPQTAPIDAYFEAVSALTTTGSSVLPRNEQLPVAILFWRCFLQWMGGGLSLLVAVLLLGPAGVGGLPPTNMRIAEHGRVSEQSRLYETLSRLLPVYFFATLLCFGALVMTGTPSFDALGLSFAALSTGGFIIRSTDFVEYVPLGSTWIFTIFMLFGATNILWQRAVAERRWNIVRANHETAWMFALAAGLGLIIAGNLFRLGGDSLLRSLTDGFFTAASLISTTGVESRTGSFGVLPITALLIILIVGGGAFSTAGGIKLFRFGAMIVQAYRELNRLVYPHGVRRARFGSQPYDMQMMKAIWSAMTVSLMLICIVIGVLTAEHFGFEDAVVLTVATLSNAGTAYQPSVIDTGDFTPIAALSPLAKFTLCALMVLGRLEILALASLLRVSTWRR